MHPKTIPLMRAKCELVSPQGVTWILYTWDATPTAKDQADVDEKLAQGFRQVAGWRPIPWTDFDRMMATQFGEEALN